MMLTGVYVPLITPFDDTGAVALDALEELTHQVLRAGVAGVVALGTTAEPASLDARERRAVLDVVAGVCRERDAALVVGADTVQAVAALPSHPGVVAALSLVPPFLRPGEAGVLAHFAALTAASPVPVLVYHVPYRTGQQLSTGAIRRLAELPGIAGIKYTVGGIDGGTVELLADPPPGFAVLGGDDTLISPLLALGAHGGIVASAHVGTAAFVELARVWRAGDAVRARSLGHQLGALSSALFAEPNPTVIKAVLHAQRRIPTPAVRLPLVPPDPETVRTAIRLAQDDECWTLSLQGLA
ncbi:dihydrodipicolinate synthase family protein [Plantactinospora sp. WMMB782]|uniref:dihydrodipicolinate synthase family protein n=1 Tax=Plantactinospora sp. WMMB782 TaxID=3404121 RepID=UPI003B92F6C4